MIDVNILSTGSDGNCVVLDNVLMLDAGLTRKCIEEMGVVLEDLALLFVSHEHADHANLATVRYCVLHDVASYLPERVVEKLREKYKHDDWTAHMSKNIHLHAPNRVIDVSEFVDDCEAFKLKLLPQKHYDILNYAVLAEKDDYRLLYATDLDTVGVSDVGSGLMNLGVFDAILLEGNYDEGWLREYIDTIILMLDPNAVTDDLTDKELERFVRRNYRNIPKELSANLFRAVQNMRHLSKQQARAYVLKHLKKGGRYYEIHRSKQFYEKPSDWDTEDAIAETSHVVPV